MSSSKSVTLVLSSGGARGLAHIGIIRQIEAHGLKIKAICGSSMGALIGGIHAMGKLDDYEEWVCSLRQRDILKLLDWHFSGGLIKGNKLMQQLAGMLGKCNIEDLAISFIAVAVDLNRGREVWFDQVSVFDAIRASIAIPGIFTPHYYKGMKLVDGGLLNPLPLAPSLISATSFCIAVDLNNNSTSQLEPDDSDPDTFSDDDDDDNWSDKLRDLLGRGPNNSTLDTPQIMIRSLELMQSQLTRHNLALYKPDLLISIPGDACGMHEFHRAKEMIRLGANTAKQALAARELDQ